MLFYTDNQHKLDLIHYKYIIVTTITITTNTTRPTTLLQPLPPLPVHYYYTQCSIQLMNVEECKQPLTSRPCHGNWPVPWVPLQAASIHTHHGLLL